MYFEEQIRNKVKEHAIVIDKKGNVYEFIGNKDSVNIADVDLKGAYVTHNHPESEGIVSFGENDFNFLRENSIIKELRCCNKEYNYSIKVLKSLAEIVYNDIYREGLQKWSEPDFEAQDAAMQVLHEKGYVKYEKRRIKH